MKKSSSLVALALMCIILVTCSVGPLFMPSPDIESSQDEDPESQTIEEPDPSIGTIRGYSDARSILTTCLTSREKIPSRSGAPRSSLRTSHAY